MYGPHQKKFWPDTPVKTPSSRLLAVAIVANFRRVAYSLQPTQVAITQSSYSPFPTSRSN